jgi:recombination protein RecA
MDRYLPWLGFPKAAVSLMIGEAGGTTALWQRALASVTQRGQRGAWVNGPTSSMNPCSLRQRGVNLGKVLTVSAPPTLKQRLWALQELMSLSLFEVVGCDFGSEAPRDSHVRHLKKIALRYQASLVLFTSSQRASLSSYYSLILRFDQEHMVVHRALHRPTPYLFERRDVYADTLPQLATRRQALSS